MKWINWNKWLQNWPKLQSMSTMCLSEYLKAERLENPEKCTLCLKEYSGGFVILKKKKKLLLNFRVWCKDCWCLRSVKCGLQENCAGCNVANQFSDQICPREKHGIYHNQASSRNQIFRILSIFDKIDRGKALYKDKRVGVLEWWQWQARYILVMKWILYKCSASEIQILCLWKRIVGYCTYRIKD